MPERSTGPSRHRRERQGRGRPFPSRMRRAAPRTARSRTSSQYPEGDSIMIIKVLGPGCSKCVEAYEIVSKAVAASGSDATVEKVTDLREIMAWACWPPLRWSSMAASCARGASPVRKKSGAGSAPEASGGHAIPMQVPVAQYPVRPGCATGATHSRGPGCGRRRPPVRCPDARYPDRPFPDHILPVTRPPHEPCSPHAPPSGSLAFGLCPCTAGPSACPIPAGPDLRPS